MKRILFILFAFASLAVDAQTVQSIRYAPTYTGTTGVVGVVDSANQRLYKIAVSALGGGGGANNYVTSGSFANNTLTLNRNGLSAITATLDSTYFSTRAWRQKLADSLSSLIAANAAATVTNANAITTKANIDTIYILVAGQSNANGYNDGNVDSARDAEVSGWNGTTWVVLAQGVIPLGMGSNTAGSNPYVTGAKANSNPAYWAFARELRAKYRRPVKVVNVSWGGNPIQNWINGQRNWTVTDSIANVTTRNGARKFDYMIWDQGETNQLGGSYPLYDTGYYNKLDTVMMQFRAANYINAATPIILTGLFHEKTAGYRPTTFALMAYAARHRFYYFSSIDGLADIGDNTHINAVSASELGRRRYFDALEKKTYRTSTTTRTAISGYGQHVMIGVPVIDTVLYKQYTFDSTEWQTTLGESFQNVQHQLLFQNTQQSVTSTTNETTVFTGTIPVTSIGPNGTISIMTLVSATNNANVKTVKVKLNGTIVHQYNPNSVSSERTYAIISNRNSLTSQVAGAAAASSGLGFGTSGQSSVVISTFSIDFSAAVTVSITIQLATSSDTCSLEAFQLWVVK